MEYFFQGLVKAGLNVVGLARKIDKLQEIKTRLQNEKNKFYPIQTDVTKEDEILRAFQWIEKELGGIDILVNNAGIILNEPIIGKLASLNFNESPFKHQNF